MQEGDQLLWVGQCQEDSSALLASSAGKAVHLATTDSELRPMSRHTRGLRVTPPPPPPHPQELQSDSAPLHALSLKQPCVRHIQAHKLHFCINTHEAATRKESLVVHCARQSNASSVFPYCSPSCLPCWYTTGDVGCCFESSHASDTVKPHVRYFQAHNLRLCIHT